MSLLPFRQVQELNTDFITLNTAERGGILSLGSASGMTIAELSTTASGVVPLGFAYNDVEWVDHSRQPLIYSRFRKVEVPLGIVGIAMEGDFETDWVQITGNVTRGDKAYLGPSGIVTNDSSYGGHQIGWFLSTLKPDRHLVIFKGAGFNREKVDERTKLVVWENNPAHREFVVSDGSIKVRIKQDVITSSIKTASEN